jgi:hypothetical protein
VAKRPVLEFRNVQRVTANLRRLAERAPQVVGEAMRAEYEIEMTEAKRRTPVDTGALRSSGHVTGPRREGNTIEVSLNFGGPSVDYALKVHEDLESFHRVGQAKFLERVLDESAPFIPARVAERVRRRLR